MQITKEILNTGPAPEYKHNRVYATMLLALNSDVIYCFDGSNSYIPKWTVCNSEFYNLNMDKFDGWIQLEDIIPGNLRKKCRNNRK